jgi:hypothetical protein
MKEILISIIAAVALLTAPGCTTTATKPTHEAIIFYTFADTWAVSKAAYAGYCELAVQGKVSASDQVDIDRQWNTFRSTFKSALTVANNNWSAATPEDARKIANDLLTLIRSLP